MGPAMAYVMEDASKQQIVPIWDNLVQISSGANNDSVVVDILQSGSKTIDNGAFW